MKKIGRGTSQGFATGSSGSASSSSIPYVVAPNLEAATRLAKALNPGSDVKLTACDYTQEMMIEFFGGLRERSKRG